MSSTRLFSLLVPACFLLACGEATGVLVDDEFGAASAALTLAPGSAEKLLSLVNYPGTDLSTLDTKAGLDRRAAAGILAHRDGADGRALTADDDLFDTVAELDAVPYVGDVALQKLLAFAEASPVPAGEVVEGVTFRGWEAELVVWGVNAAPAGTLDGMLDARAAAALLAHRPFTTVTQMGPLPYVGPSALERLRREAATWWKARLSGLVTTLAGTFDGVVFDEATAAKALQLANAATLAQLTSAGVYATGASAIVAARPLPSLAAVAALEGVGPASMQALKNRAPSWGAPAATLLEVQTALVEASADLWMPSETDAHFVLLTGSQLNGAITVAEVRAQFTAQHDQLIQTVMYTDPSERSLAAKTLVEERSFPAFFDHIIGAADPNDPDSLAGAQRFEHLKAVFGATLTEVKVYRFGRISISTFIVGRAPSGELVGLLTGQVET